MNAGVGSLKAFRDLESVVCDADNMVDVLMSIIEPDFAKGGDNNLVVTGAERDRIFFVACQALNMCRALRKAYYAAWEAPRDSDEGGHQ